MTAATVEALEDRTLLDGSLDAGWGSGGIVFLKSTIDVQNVAPRPDGSVIANGRRASHDNVLYRLTADGSLDVSYGNIAVGQTSGFAVGAQSNNQVLFATGYGVRRYSSTGTLQQTSKGPELNSASSAVRVEAFTRLADDSFAIAGQNIAAAHGWSGIEWFNADGTHRVSIRRSATIVSMAGAADGKLLVLIASGSGYLLARYQTNGQLDPTFANDVRISAPAGASFSSVSLDSSNRIYVGGHLPETDVDYTGIVVMRLLSDGSADPSYPAPGPAVSGLVGRGVSMQVAPDGRMYVAVVRWGRPGEEDPIIDVFRLTTTGQRDNSWSAENIDVTNQTGNGSLRVHDLEFMRDGDVVVSGIGVRVDHGVDQRKTGFVFRLTVDPVPAISGKVFSDLNANAVRDVGDAGLKGWRVYVDSNDNGVLDSGEPSVRTRRSGYYAIMNLNPGTYRLRIVEQPGWRRTRPSRGYYTVKVSPASTVTGRNWGQTSNA